MNNKLSRFEGVFAAAAFAEGGEFETAKQIMNESIPERRERLSKLERLMMAVTFAEAGEHKTAKEIMNDRKRPRKRDRVSPRPRKQLRAPGIDR